MFLPFMLIKIVQNAPLLIYVIRAFFFWGAIKKLHHTLDYQNYFTTKKQILIPYFNIWAPS